MASEQTLVSLTALQSAGVPCCSSRCPHLCRMSVVQWQVHFECGSRKRRPTNMFPNKQPREPLHITLRRHCSPQGTNACPSTRNLTWLERKRLKENILAIGFRCTILLNCFGRLACTQGKKGRRPATCLVCSGQFGA